MTWQRKTGWWPKRDQCIGIKGRVRVGVDSKKSTSALCDNYTQKGSTTWQHNGLSSKRFLWQFSSHAHVDTFLQREDQDLTPLLTIPKQGIRRISSSHLLTTFGENFHFDLVAVLYAY